MTLELSFYRFSGPQGRRDWLRWFLYVYIRFQFLTKDPRLEHFSTSNHTNVVPVGKGADNQWDTKLKEPVPV